MKLNYVELNVGDKTYKLRLSTRNILGLEKQLGMNPLTIFGVNGDTIPTITQMVYILYSSLIQYNHGITLEDTYDIFDAYMEEHSATDFINVILEIYTASGLIEDKEENNDPKNE